MKSFTLRDTDPALLCMQRFLNEKLNLELTTDGNMGKITQSALLSFQQSVGITEQDANGACYGPDTQAIIVPFADNKYVSDKTFEKIASIMKIPLASLRTVTEVEAKQFGFLPSGHPSILFERHKFYKDLVRLKGQGFADSITATNPDICNPQAGGYVGKQGEVTRFDRAAAIHKEAAMLSTSWGLFQIMGFNYMQAGFNSVTSYVEAMFASEEDQLKAFANYVKNDKDQSLFKALVNQLWAPFAGEYNGPAYKQNMYDTKLDTGFKKWVKLLGATAASPPTAA